MTRDFTEAEKTKLLGYVQQDQDKNGGRICGGIIDWFADGINYGGLDINDYINNLDTYHMKLIDKEDYTSEDIENLFAAVVGIDADYQSKFSSKGTMLEAINTMLTDLGALVSVGSYSPESMKIFLSTDEFDEEISGIGDELVDYYYQQFMTIDAEGNEVIDWNAVEAFFQQDISDINSMECAAMIRVTDLFIIIDEDGRATVDVEGMSRFMECGYSYDYSDPFNPGDGNIIFKIATITPAYEYFYLCLQAQTDKLLADNGYCLYDTTRLEDDVLEQFLRGEALKASVLSTSITNFQTVQICNQLVDEDVYDDWTVNITIEPVMDNEKLSHYTVSVMNDGTTTIGKPSDVDVYLYGNTLEFAGHSSITQVATSLIVDVDQAVTQSRINEVVDVSLDFVVDEFAKKHPTVKILYIAGSYLIEEDQLVAQAEAQNATVNNLLDIEDARYYGGALSMGGSVTVCDQRWQIVNQCCNEIELRDKIEWYIETSVLDNDETITDVQMQARVDEMRETLLNDYNNMLGGDEPSQLMIDFAYEVSLNYGGEEGESDAN